MTDGASDGALVGGIVGLTVGTTLGAALGVVQAHVNIGEPRADQIDTLIMDMIKGLAAATNDHRLKHGNIWLKELLEKRVAEARAASPWKISSQELFNLGVLYGLVPSRVAASSYKDNTKPKQGKRVRWTRTRSPSFAPVVEAPITRLRTAS